MGVGWYYPEHRQKHWRPMGDGADGTWRTCHGSGQAARRDWTVVIATAAEFHYKAVHAHPFEDGNGRWARMVANIWQFQHGMPITIWPVEGLRDTASPIREEYIKAIKEADHLNFNPLIDLHAEHLEVDE